RAAGPHLDPPEPHPAAHGQTDSRGRDHALDHGPTGANDANERPRRDERDGRPPVGKRNSHYRAAPDEGQRAVARDAPREEAVEIRVAPSTGGAAENDRVDRVSATARGRDLAPARV